MRPSTLAYLSTPSVHNEPLEVMFITANYSVALHFYIVNVSTFQLLLAVKSYKGTLVTPCTLELISRSLGSFEKATLLKIQVL